MDAIDILFISATVILVLALIVIVLVMVYTHYRHDRHRSQNHDRLITTMSGLDKKGRQEYYSQYIIKKNNGV